MKQRVTKSLHAGTENVSCITVTFKESWVISY